MTDTTQHEALRLADAIEGSWLENVNSEEVDVPMIQSQLRRIPELEAGRDQLLHTCNSYKTLTSSLEAQRSVLNDKLKITREAVSSLASEREANAILTAENDKLRAQVDALRADAERYRWLRDSNVGPSMIDKVCREGHIDYMSLKCDVELDFAIDAARAKVDA